MRKLTLDGLLYLRSIAKTTRDNLEASHAVRMYIAERDPLAQNALAYFNDTFSNDFVPFYTFRKYQDALSGVGMGKFVSHLTYSTRYPSAGTSQSSSRRHISVKIPCLTATTLPVYQLM